MRPGLPDGNLLYFFSERDGFPCIWAQRVEPLTKHPLGDMFPVYHLHHARRSVRSLDNLGVARLSTAPGKLVFSMGDVHGQRLAGEHHGKVSAFERTVPIISELSLTSSEHALKHPRDKDSHSVSKHEKRRVERNAPEAR